MKLTMHRRPLDREDLRLELKYFETRYGVPSAERSAAFTDADGIFRETDDWRRWDALYAIWRRVFADSPSLA